MAGATGNIYCGLLEFEEMSFVLHLLRPGDLMGDIGANVGVYTILAAKNVGANVIAIEPVPIAFQHLQNNVRLNHIENLAIPINCGAGADNMELEFTEALDALNHVADPTELRKEGDLIKVKVKPLDDIFVDAVPVLLKIDVEGFEQAVIKGTKRLLHSRQLKSIIIELNGSGMRYGYSDEKIDAELASYGFKRYSYNPFTRKLEEIEKYGKFNTIYLRDEDWANERISSAKSFEIFEQCI
jgi:FkbM family methyltransferase